jgi:hypothetical protein
MGNLFSSSGGERACGQKPPTLVERPPMEPEMQEETLDLRALYGRRSGGIPRFKGDYVMHSLHDVDLGRNSDLAVGSKYSKRPTTDR